MPRITPQYLHWAVGFARKPEVLRIAGLTGRTRADVAVTLMEFYEWADATTEDGKLPGVDVTFLSHVCHNTDVTFWNALASVGWLTILDDSIEIPNFDYWMGSSAKRRLNNARRQAKNRNKAPLFDGMSHVECDKNVTSIGRERERESINTPYTPQGGFAAFWNLYPRKTGIGAAEKSWGKIAPGPELCAQILASVRVHLTCDQWQKEDGKFIPLASTWLNQRRWRDDPLHSGKPATDPSRYHKPAPRMTEAERQANLDAARKARQGGSDEPTE